MLSLRKLAMAVLAALLFSPPLACAEIEGELKLTPTESEKLFLDRLMMAESRGRRTAKNPASSALGPYQFIEATFLDLMKRRLPGVASGKSDAHILTLRTDLTISRNVALIYTRENARALAAKGIETNEGNLRLAFFVGAFGASKVLRARPEERVSNFLGAAALQANPFLKEMTASELLAKARRDAEGGALSVEALPVNKVETVSQASGDPSAQLNPPQAVIARALEEKPEAAAAPSAVQSVAASEQAPLKLAIGCNLKLPSCRKWAALAQRRGAPNGATLVMAKR
jgi:hypothetical protein